MKRKITIAVTGLNATDNPGSGIPVIRSLRESKLFDVRIVGLSYETLEPGIYLHELVDKTYLIPLPSQGTHNLVRRLKQIQEKENIEVIIPNFDSELFNFIKVRNELAQLGIRSFLPDEQQFESRQKIQLAKFGKDHGITVPRSATIYSASELNNLPAELQYPIVVKGKFYDAGIAHYPAQAQQLYTSIYDKWGGPLILQEVIKGQEVNVTAIGDGKGNLCGMVAMRKQYITDKGKAWSGISIKDQSLHALAERFMQSTKWRGPCELEIIKTDDNINYLIEVNPRFPAWMYLATGCGQNHAEQLLQLALEQPVTMYNDYVAGKLFIRYSFDLIVDLKEYERISTQNEL